MQIRRIIALAVIVCFILPCTVMTSASEQTPVVPVASPQPLSADAAVPSDGELPNAMGERPSDLEVASLQDSGGLPMLSTPPASFDLRSVGGVSYVTGVRNQNPFGTCWAHGAIASCESNLLMDGRGSYDFSELHLSYYAYTRNAATATAGGGTAGDILSHSAKDTSVGDYPLDYGGNSSMAVTTLANQLGLIPESMLPYPGLLRNSSYIDCYSDPYYLHAKNQDLNVSYAYGKDTFHLQNAYFVSHSDRNVIKTLLMEMGAASISYCHINGTSYLNKTTSAFYQPNNHFTNHAVTLIGWNDNYSASNFSTTPPGNGAWLCKNSWGTNWCSAGGYFWLSYYDAAITAYNNYKPYVTFFDVEPVDGNQYLYQYDGGAAIGSRHYYSSASGCANIFTSEQDETLSSVSYYTGAPNTTVTISIYTGGSTSSPISGSRRVQQTVVEPYQGYHTTVLNVPINLSEGTTFSVVLDMSVPTGYASLIYDYNEGSYDCGYYPYGYDEGNTLVVSKLSTSLTCRSGESYYKANADSSWNQSDVNFRIKAHTDLQPVSSVYGDINNDLRVTVADGVLIARHIAGVSRLSPGRLGIADIYKDNAIDVTDILYMCKYLAGFYSSLPINP